MKKVYGTEAMPETGENVAEEFQISRADQDKFAYRSQMRAKAAQESGFFGAEITPVTIKGAKATRSSIPTSIRAAIRPWKDWPSCAHRSVIRGR